MTMRRRKPDYAKIDSLERELDLPSTVSPRQKLKEVAKRPHKLSDYQLRDRRFKRQVQACVGTFLCSVVALVYISFYTEAFTQPPRLLPPGVLVGPNDSFVVDPGEEGLGVELCNEGKFETAKVGHRVLVNCLEGAPKFRYPETSLWIP